MIDPQSGYSIKKFENLRGLLTESLLGIIQSTKIHLSSDGRVLTESQIFSLLLTNHEIFKEKKARIFPHSEARSIVPHILDWARNYSENCDFITDEENLGYPNVYIRVVRALHNEDVGPMHADKWFWDLGSLPFPKTHRRLKVWAPLLQNDAKPALKIYPASHTMTFDYEGQRGSDGKMRPILNCPSISNCVVRAPVKVGECIVFHDSLLHGGAVDNSNRISVEFTLAIKN
jgi:hypothetical protein